MLCQFCPQFLDMDCHLLVFDPFRATAITSPAPPTFVISTRSKYEFPFIVNLIPPGFSHGTLHVNYYQYMTKIGWQISKYEPCKLNRNINVFYILKLIFWEFSAYVEHLHQWDAVLRLLTNKKKSILMYFVYTFKLNCYG